MKRARDYNSWCKLTNVKAHFVPPAATSTGTNRCTWKLKNGYYVLQQHGKTNECYSETVAKQKCQAARDCKAIATQSNVCGGEWRVTHGGPTFTYYRHWRHYRLKAQECVA